MSVIQNFFSNLNSDYGVSALDSQTLSSSVLNANNEALLELIDSLSSKDTILGKVLSSSDDVIEIMTKDGNSVLAKNSAGILLEPGSSVVFEVSKNQQNEISLKPLCQNMNQQITAETALKEAGLPLNERTLSMVVKNMEYGLPIDKSSILESYKDVYSFDKAPVSAIVDLQFMKIPVTTDNLTQFEAYQNMKHSVTEGYFEITKSLFSTLETVPNHEAISMLKDFYSSLGEVFESKEIPVSLDALKNMVASFDREGLNLPNLLKLSNQTEVSFSQIADAISKDLEPPTLKSELSNHEPILTDPSVETEKPLQSLVDSFVDQLLKSGVFRKTTESFLLNQWSFKKPEDVSKESIRDLYERLFSDSFKLNDAVSKLNENFEPVKTLSQNLNDNLSFMNALNSFVPYVQIPISMEPHGKSADLYVYSNKKSLASKDGEISAFIHLDMDHLGPTDVFVKLNGDHVSTHFTLSSEENLRFVESHMDFLEKRLSEKGYSLETSLKQCDSPKSALEQTMEMMSHKLLLAKTSFDARV